MNLSHYVSEVSSQLSDTSPSSYPGLLWTYYIRYLWNYQQDSWVARIAYSCRVIALLVSLPIIILGLLDITSYAIARTLGVIDDVKASTSDKATVHLAGTPPTIRVDDDDSLYTIGDSDRDSLMSENKDESDSGLVVPEHPKEFFATDNNLKLSGVGVFSPATSRPSSPILTRKNLQVNTQPVLKEEEEPHLRHRQHQHSTSDDS